MNVVSAAELCHSTVTHVTLFRSTPPSRPNNISGSQMSVRPYVHKKFLRFQWNLVCR